MRRIVFPGTLLLALVLSGCTGSQSILDPVGPTSGAIYNLWWLLFWVSIVVWIVVTGYLFAGVFRARLHDSPPPETEQKLTKSVAIATGITVVTLFVILVASTMSGRTLAYHQFKDPVNLNVVAHQWWWEVHYENSRPDLGVTTANEIHIPVGRPVVLKITADDVIHSFWAPNLFGKIDAIPSHVNTIWFRADRAGTYRGQCAEYCGLQHAHMAFLVTAEDPAAFDRWLNGQRQTSHAPDTLEESKGETVFLGAPCVLCHTIRGTPAGGQVAPDLTHLASREYIAAGTVPNTIGHLGGWITDSQTVKPGNHMPAMNLNPVDMQPLLTYLKSLK